MAKINTGKKPHGVSFMGDMQPESTMQLEGKHATTVKSHMIGKKVQMMVTGTKMSHRQNGDGTMSANYKIHSVKMNDANQTGAGDKNDADNSDSHQ